MAVPNRHCQPVAFVLEIVSNFAVSFFCIGRDVVSRFFRVMDREKSREAARKGQQGKRIVSSGALDNFPPFHQVFHLSDHTFDLPAVPTPKKTTGGQHCEPACR